MTSYVHKSNSKTRNCRRWLLQERDKSRFETMWRIESGILAANAELMESLMIKNQKSIPEAAAYEYYQEVDLMNSF